MEFGDTQHLPWGEHDVEVPYGLQHRRTDWWADLLWPPQDLPALHLEFRRPRRELSEKDRDAVRSILVGEPASEWCRRWGVDAEGHSYG